MSTKHMPILKAAIEAELKKESNCSWCQPGNGDAKTSHGMCDFHLQKMIAEILADREKKAQIEALPAPIERLAKPQAPAASHTTKTVERGRKIVLSKNETPWSYNGIDIV